MSTARKSRGRQKIEMKKMSNESNLQVTFSKRRGGLFNKASELCTLCGAEVAIIVFSPGQKVFSFGHPSVQTIIDRYLMHASMHSSGTMQFIEAQRSASVCELNEQLTRISNQLDVEKKRSDELSRLQKTVMTQFWWALSIENMDKTQLNQLKAALEKLKKSVMYYAEKLHIQGIVANPPQPLLGLPSSSDVVHHQPPFPPPTTHHVSQLFASHIRQPLMLNGENRLMHNPMFADWSMLHQHGFNINTGMGGFGNMGGLF
ncbi:agamous-like MADS-box protein AGL62 [Arachis stenosperma]|uniref:agamous-like MADS-box protein AGL62 n=1 Tax=Arachis stenosperma TaxID=217475 RepID=UPI0025AC735C|nr:agamous-like MADS-box protein AGL62 [Arachis stenosperma]